MGTSITVRDIDPGDKSWLRREARQTGVSMEELVRRLIHEKRTKTDLFCVAQAIMASPPSISSFT